MKIAFVGHPAVGKDALSDYVSKTFDMVHISSGDLIREYVKKNNLGELDRKTLQKAANDLRHEHGGDYLVKLALEKTADNVIVSGLRAIDEVATFKKLGGTVVAVTAPIERRYELAKLRGRIGDTVTFEAFKKIEEEENKSADKNAQNVNEVIAMADVEIVNDGTLEDLFRKGREMVGVAAN